MSDYFIIQDTEKCIGCHACEIQCKTHKALPVGPKLFQIIEVSPQLIDGLPMATFVFLPCFPFHEAWCIAACPTGAMQRRQAGLFMLMPTCVLDARPVLLPAF